MTGANGAEISCIALPCGSSQKSEVHGGCAEMWMLKSLPAPVSVVVCSTCRFSKESRLDPDGRTGGTLFADAITGALAGHACRGRIDVQPMSCLFACSNHCTIYVRGDGRLGYLLGRFEPAPAHAEAVLDYLLEYLGSADGVVPYAKWPAGVKGHFLARLPPQGQVWQPA